MEIDSDTFEELVQIDPVTAVATAIGNTLDEFESMAFDENGTLYALTSEFPDSLTASAVYTINKTTGAPTFLVDASAGGRGWPRPRCSIR